MEGTGLADVYSRAFAITEEVCAAAAAELRRQKISAVNSDFLQDHLGDITVSYTHLKDESRSFHNIR